MEMKPRGKCTYSLIKGLYGELERARREYENDASSEGGIAYGLWLELLEIADWHFEGAPGLAGDSPDVEGDDPDAPDDADGPDESGPQLQLPGIGRVAADVPRGTRGKQGQPAPVVGAGAGLTPAGSSEQKGVIRGTRRTLP